MKLGNHIHQQYDKELESVRSRVLSMGGLVERQIGDALLAMSEQDTELADYVIRTDHRVNAQEVSIDEDCVYILARRQPAAGDLRMVMTIIKTITDLERMGDESEKIAHMVSGFAPAQVSGYPVIVEHITQMGELVRQMLRDALDTFARMDVPGSIATAKRDREVDHRYVNILTEITDCIKKNPADVDTLQRLIWTARSLERIGDHSKNICEYVPYLVRGKDIRHISIDMAEQDLNS